MKPLDKYKLKLKLFALSSLVWDTLVFFSWIVLFMFILITSLLFWAVLGDNLYNSGTNILSRISWMFRIVMVVIGIIVINQIIKAIKGIRRKDEKDM